MHVKKFKNSFLNFHQIETAILNFSDENCKIPTSEAERIEWILFRKSALDYIFIFFFVDLITKKPKTVEMF